MRMQCMCMCTWMFVHVYLYVCMRQCLPSHSSPTFGGKKEETLSPPSPRCNYTFQKTERMGAVRIKVMRNGMQNNKNPEVTPAASSICTPLMVLCWRLELGEPPKPDEWWVEVDPPPPHLLFGDPHRQVYCLGGVMVPPDWVLCESGLPPVFGAKLWCFFWTRN